MYQELTPAFTALILLKWLASQTAPSSSGWKVSPAETPNWDKHSLTLQELRLVLMLHDNFQSHSWNRMNSQSFGLVLIYFCTDSYMGNAWDLPFCNVADWFWSPMRPIVVILVSKQKFSMPAGFPVFITAVHTNQILSQKKQCDEFNICSWKLE